jgi:omega-6 fatty acid desaturase (delta-12 desaturase)
MNTSLNGDVAVASAAPTSTWREVVTKYQHTEVPSALVQLVTTLLPLALGFTLMFFSLAWPYWVTLLLAIPTAGFLVRTFIIMHDCSHSSFLPWRRANDIVGGITGLLTLTPFSQWRRDHAIHHASSGDLDRRGHGDVHTITVKEYLSKSRLDRFKYRMVRHPVALLAVGPLWLMYSQRFRTRTKATKDKQIMSVWGTNAAIVISVLLAWGFGFLPQFLMVYFPVMYLAGVAGVFLFYVQHQFEDTYWAPHENWEYAKACIAGSSYLKLPQPLAWMTGNIGVHHVHHISPKIPNYKLKQCHDENPLFHEVRVLTLRDAFKTLTLSLWNEEKGRLVRFKDVSA